MRLPATIVVGLASVLVVAACGGTVGGGAPQLQGRTFLSTQVEGRALVPETRVQLSFDQGSVGASAGCNSMGGDYSLDGNRLVVKQLAQTEMACEPLLMQQDQWLADLLMGGSTITLVGDTLTLEASGVRLTLLDRKVANPDRPLEGTRWVVDGLVSNGAVSSVPGEAEASITIANGRADVEAGCNQGGAQVEIGDGSITFGPLALTKMACDADRMALEQGVSAAISGRLAFTIDADRLTLISPAGTGLVLRAES
jgi:heat shock protein HslJ